MAVMLEEWVNRALQARGGVDWSAIAAFLVLPPPHVAFLRRCGILSPFSSAEVTIPCSPPCVMHVSVLRVVPVVHLANCVR